MSSFNATQSVCNACAGAAALLIGPSSTDLGEFSVRRALPAPERRRLVVIGGAQIGERHLYRNFVSSRPERVREAADRCKAGGFERIDGNDEFIPLP